ncbi:transposase [Streptomyces fodineus]|uniref:transposase n=1 Tax=Streptomyces fodineus TaxID=1904616 RepID=UPI000BFF7565
MPWSDVTVVTIRGSTGRDDSAVARGRRLGRWSRRCCHRGLSGHRGPKPVADRLCLQRILYVLHQDIAWQLLPLKLGFGSGQTCWRRLGRWQQAGLFQQLHRILLANLKKRRGVQDASPNARQGVCAPSGDHRQDPAMS